MRKLLFLASLLLSVTCNAATPVLSANALQVCYEGTSKPILTILSGSGKTSYVSGVINDPTDCSITKGIYFTATENPTSFIITSDKISVVPVANVNMTLISGDQYVCKITPISVGFATIKIKAYNGSSSSTYTIEYAASAASSNPTKTIFPTGIADASGAAAIDDDYMFVADDETNLLRLFNRKNSGKSLYSVNITTAAGGSSSEEFDLEGATNSSASYNSGKRIYWIASLGNSKSGNLKPYRDRVIATDISGTGANTTLSVKSYSTKMRTALISWGNANSWNFTASAATGMIPKRIDGFNIEGLTLTNTGESAYIGFRAPCVPVKGTTPTSGNRTYAVIAPVTNFETMMNVTGNSSITPTIGEPILFDFEGLGIRSIEKVGGNKYIIVAGLFEGGGIPAIYLWDGTIPANSGTTPISVGNYGLIELPLDMSDLVQASSDGSVEGHPEALLAEQVGNDLHIHVICDNGTVDYYNNATEAKVFAADSDEYPFAKYRMDDFSYTLISTNIGCEKVSGAYSCLVKNNSATISGLPQNAAVCLYDIKGNKLIDVVSISSGLELPLPYKGVFIITVKNSDNIESIKVLNK